MSSALTTLISTYQLPPHCSVIQVHYRHTVTNKWVLLAVTSANTDAFTEHMLDLSPYFNAKDGLFTQYLRIRPVAHHKKPCMRISVYGVDATKAASVSESDRSEGSTLIISAVCCSAYICTHRNSIQIHWIPARAPTMFPPSLTPSSRARPRPGPPMCTTDCAAFTTRTETTAIIAPIRAPARRNVSIFSAC